MLELKLYTWGCFGDFLFLFFDRFFAQIFGYAGIQYSSPTLGTAMLNLVPGFTFILAIIFRSSLLSSLFLSFGMLQSPTLATIESPIGILFGVDGYNFWLVCGIQLSDDGRTWFSYEFNVSPVKEG